MFVMSAECARLGLNVRTFLFNGLSIHQSPAPLQAAMTSAAQGVRERFRDVASLRQARELDAFRRIYSASGVNPKRQQPACERLVELTWRRGDLPRINNLVDAYNMVSVNQLLSIGAHDLDAIELPVHLKIVSGTEPFTRLGASDPEPLKSGEFAYVDARGRVICRLDVIQADFSRITAQTSNAYVIVEATIWHSDAAFDAGCAEVADLIARYCVDTTLTPD